MLSKINNSVLVFQRCDDIFWIASKFSFDKINLHSCEKCKGFSYQGIVMCSKIIVQFSCIKIYLYIFVFMYTDIY